MSAQENKEIVRRYFGGRFNDKDYSVVDQYLAPDATPTPDEQKAWLDDLHGAWPDMHSSIDHLIAEDDLVAVHFTMGGTLAREWEGLTPNGKSIEVHGMALVWLKDGMIVKDDVNYTNLLEMMMQA